MKITQKVSTGIWLLLAIILSGQAEAQLRYNYISPTTSPEAQKTLAAIYEAKAYARIFPAYDDLPGWRKTHDDAETAKKALSEAAVKKNKVTVAEAKMGGVPVLDIRPSDWKDNGKILVYTHGGAYTMFSAFTTLNSSAPMARVTGLRIISVDYTTSPFANWETIQEQVISVFKALLADGYTMKDIVLYGDSAGGGLATSTILNLRDQELGIPAAVALLSPWVDISNAGDTMKTLEYTDPSLHYDPLLKSSAMAYADGLPLTDPRVSALYGDFSKGFSPAIITEGTKCIFLSTSVRLFQTLEASGQDVKLDVYEGMWHVFQVGPCPETETSLNKISTFFNQHLGISE